MIPSFSIAFFVASSLMAASVESGASNDYHDHRPKRSAESLDAMKLDALDKNLFAMSNLRGLQSQRRIDQADTAKASSSAPDLLFERAAASPAVTTSNPTITPTQVSVSAAAVHQVSGVVSPVTPVTSHSTSTVAPPVNATASDEGSKGCSHPRDVKCKKNEATVSAAAASRFDLLLLV